MHVDIDVDVDVDRVSRYLIFELSGLIPYFSRASAPEASNIGYLGSPGLDCQKQVLASSCFSQ